MPYRAKGAPNLNVKRTDEEKAQRLAQRKLDMRNRSAKRQADSARAKLNVTACLFTIAKVETELNAKWKTLNSDQISALKLRADIGFKKLAKVLPDLKSIEFAGGGESDLLFRVRLMPGPSNEGPEPIEGEVEVEQLPVMPAIAALADMEQGLADG